MARHVGGSLICMGFEVGGGPGDRRRWSILPPATSRQGRLTMKQSPTFLQWFTTGIMCWMISMLLWNPNMLPEPVRQGVYTSVDGAARFWLWLWNEPAEVSFEQSWQEAFQAGLFEINELTLENERFYCAS